MSWVPLVLALVTIVGGTAALLLHRRGSRRESTRTRTAEELIETVANEPIGNTIQAVVSAFRAQPAVWLPTDRPGSDGKLHLKVADDKYGRTWIYLYTSEAKMLLAFPGGTTFASMSFDDAFRLAAEEARFGGLSINHGESRRYLIPRELFEMVAPGGVAPPNSDLQSDGLRPPLKP